nr:hypothetical protein [Tanacetum cinerariifolium]
MPTSYQYDLAETQATFGSKSNTSSIPTFESNDFVFYENSDKSSASETYDFASYVSCPKTNDSFSTVDVKLLPKSDVKDPSLTNGLAVVLLRRIKSHLIKDCNVHDTVDNFPFVVSKATSVPAGSRNSLASISAGRSIPAASRNISASIHAGRSIPAASRNKPASIHAGKRICAGRINKPAPFPVGSSVLTGLTNPAAKPFFRPTNLYFDNVYWPGIYNHMFMNEGRWGSAVKSSADIGIGDSGCSRSMTRNKEKLNNFVQVKSGTVTFGGGDGQIRKRHHKNFQVVLRIPKRHDLYTFNLSDIHPEQHINCLLAKASLEETTKWHRRMAHVNFKTINMLAKHGLVEGLPLKLFTNKHNCVACNKGKQHKASYKAISAIRTISEPLQLLHMDFLVLLLSEVLITNITLWWNANDGFLVGYAAHSKAYRVYNLSSKKVEETINLRYLEDKPNIQGLGQEWYFDLDYLTYSLGYKRFKINPPVGTHDTNILAGTQADDSESECNEQVILVPYFPFNSFLGPTVHDISAPIENNLDYAEELARLHRQEYEAHSATAKHGFEFSVDTAALLPQAEIEIRRNLGPAAGDPAASSVPAGGVLAGSIVSAGNVPASGVPAGSVLASGVLAGSVPASSVPAGGILAGSIVFAEFGDPAASESVHTVLTTAPAATSLLPPGSCEHTIRFPSPSDLGNHQPTAGIFSSSSYNDDFCADVTNLALNVAVDPVATKRVNIIHPQSQIIGALQSPVQTRKPSSVAKALEDPDWVAAMQEEMQQFYNQQVWKLVPLPNGKIAIGTKWILKNKRDARGIVVRNKARLVAQGHRQEEGIDYDEVFAPVPRIEAICLFLAFSSYMGFMVYQMDVKSAFLYGEIEEEVYVTQPKGFEDPHNPKHVYRVVKALRGTIDKTLFLKKDSRHIILVQDMLKKFDMESVRNATIPYRVPKHKSKDDPDDAVNVYPFRSMIGSLTYLIASRPDIMFALEAYSDSDYAGSYGDRKSTTGLCVYSSIFWLILPYRMNEVSCGVLLYADHIVSRSLMLVVVLVHADALLYKDDHNKVAYLEKGKGWEAYEQILDF